MPRRSTTPPFAKRALIYFSIAIALGTAVSIIVPIKLRPGRNVPLWVSIMASTLPGVTMGIAGVVYGVWTNKLVKRAKELGYRVCWHCNYHLRGLPEDGTCPECGKVYMLSDLKSLWESASNTSKRDAKQERDANKQ